MSTSRPFPNRPLTTSRNLESLDWTSATPTQCREQTRASGKQWRCRKATRRRRGRYVVATQAAERRNLTILFVDLVGSTELSGRLDPEDLRALLQSYQDAVVAAIVRHQGYVANIVGDGIVAYFGWPKAFEGQAVRAVSAGLAAIAAVAKIVSPDGRRLAARAGATSGSVVVSNLDSAIGRQSGVISGGLQTSPHACKVWHHLTRLSSVPRHSAWSPATSSSRTSV